MTEVNFEVVSREQLPSDLRYGGPYGKLLATMQDLGPEQAICVVSNGRPVSSISPVLYQRMKKGEFPGLVLAQRDGKLWIFRK